MGPNCSVEFGAFRPKGVEGPRQSVIRIDFRLGYFARTGSHNDSSGVEAVGYRITYPQATSPSEEEVLALGEARHAEWLASGVCPEPRFYQALKSQWIEEMAPFFPNLHGENLNHYVIDGRDGYAEVLATSFYWREWAWEQGTREAAMAAAPFTDSTERTE